MKLSIAKKRLQRGFSIIEIMIALMLGVFLIAGMVQVFSSNQQTYSQVNGLSRLQENGRFAMEYMSREMRMIGYTGCVSSGSMSINNVLSDPSQGAAAESALGTSVTLYDNYATGQPNPTYLTGGLNGVLVKPGTDVIEIGGPSGSGAIKVEKQTGCNDNQGGGSCEYCSGAALQVTPNDTIKTGDILLITNCQSGTIFGANNANANGNIVHNAGGSPALNSTKCLGANYNGKGSFIQKFQRVVYFVGYSAANTNNRGKATMSLYRASNPDLVLNTYDAAQESVEELVEGVEDFQLLYGVDTANDDGVVDQYMTADEVTALANGAAALRTIRMSITVNSVNTVSAFQGQDDENGGRDDLLRRTFTQTVYLRNAGKDLTIN